MPASIQPRTVFLVGAGVSVEEPAGMPAALGLVYQVVSCLSSHAVVRRKILSLFDAGRKGAGHHGDFLRFETFMEVVQEHVDPQLSVLEFIREAREPNAPHLVLAQQAMKGALVVTTNFDGFIEEAIHRLGGVPHTLCAERDFLNWRDRLPSGRVPVFKLHGSVERRSGAGLSDSKGTIVATLESLTRNSSGFALPRHRAAFVSEQFVGCRLVVAGYSAADELDVVPTLMTTCPAEVTWLEFDPAAKKARDVTDDVLKGINSLPEETRSGKERLFAAWAKLLGPAFRCLRVNTGKYLRKVYGMPAIKVGVAKVSTADLIREHLDGWRRCVAHKADRAEVIGELFFRMGHYTQAGKWFDRGLKKAGAEPDGRIRLSLYLSRVLVERGRYDQAWDLFSGIPATEIRRLPGEMRVRLLHHHAFIHYKKRGLKKALALYQRCDEQAQQAGLPLLQSQAVHDMGIIWQEMGRFDEAAKCFSRSIPLSRRAGDARHVAWSEFHLATVHYLRADFRKARSAMSAAMEHAKMLNDLSHVSNCGHGLALIEFQEGRLASAIRLSRACLVQSKAAGQGEWTGMDWEHLGVCFWEAGRHRQAQRCFKTAERLLKAVADLDTLAELCCYRAELLYDECRLPDARRDAAAALAMARKGGLPEFLSRALFILGAMEYLAGEITVGRRNLRQGLRLALKVPVIALELAFTGARLGLAGPHAGVFDRLLLKWATGIYKAAGNSRRVIVLETASRTWDSGSWTVRYI